MGSLINTMYKSLDIRYFIDIMVIYNGRDPNTMKNYGMPWILYDQYYERVIY